MSFGDVRAAAQEWKRGTFSPRVLAKMVRAMGKIGMLTPQEYEPMVAHIAQVIGWSEMDVWGAIKIAGEHDFTSKAIKIDQVRALADGVYVLNHTRACELHLLLAWCARESGDYYLTTWLAEDEQGNCCSPYHQQADVCATLGIAERIPQNKRGAPHGSRRAVRLGCLPDMEFSERRGGELLHKRRVRAASLIGVSWPCSHEVVKWVESRTYFDAHTEIPCDLADTGMVPFRVPANRSKTPPLNLTQPPLTHGGTL